MWLLTEGFQLQSHRFMQFESCQHLDTPGLLWLTLSVISLTNIPSNTSTCNTIYSTPVQVTWWCKGWNRRVKLEQQLPVLQVCSPDSPKPEEPVSWTCDTHWSGVGLLDSWKHWETLLLTCSNSDCVAETCPGPCLNLCYFCLCWQIKG